MLSPFVEQDEHDSVNLDEILIEEDAHEGPSSSWQGFDAESEGSRRRSMDQKDSEKPFLPWPALRRTSVSVRKLSPIIGFDPQEVSDVGATGATT